MINTYTGEFRAISTKDAEDLRAGLSAMAEGHVLVEGTQDDIERLASTVSAKYRAERKARNKAAKKSRRANR